MAKADGHPHRAGVYAEVSVFEKQFFLAHCGMLRFFKLIISLEEYVITVNFWGSYTSVQNFMSIHLIVEMLRF